MDLYKCNKTIKFPIKPITFSMAPEEAMERDKKIYGKMQKLWIFWEWKQLSLLSRRKFWGWVRKWWFWISLLLLGEEGFDHFLIFYFFLSSLFFLCNWIYDKFLLVFPILWQFFVLKWKENMELSQLESEHINIIIMA